MVSVENKQLKYEKALEYEIFVKGEYDFAKEKIQNAECIFDVGGHIGLFSKWCRSLNKKAKIHYFEPIEELYNRAQLVLRDDKNIILNNCGISSESGEGIIFLNKEKTMQSSKYLSFLNPKGIEVNVDFIILRDYLIKNNVDKIDVLKMDIEGMEIEVLSSWGSFERGKIDNFIAEIHLLNEKMESHWIDLFFSKILGIFGYVDVKYSSYSENVFLLWAYK